MGEPIKYLGYNTLEAVVNNLVGESDTKVDETTAPAMEIDLSYLADPFKKITEDK